MGGDLNVDIGESTNRGSKITKNTSVTVEIPKGTSGDFAMPIYGASVRATEVEGSSTVQESFTQQVGGNSTVTIDATDVTFSADIVAGGSGRSVTVSGDATLSADTLTLDGASTSAPNPTPSAMSASPSRGSSVTRRGLSSLTLNFCAMGKRFRGTVQREQTTRLV